MTFMERKVAFATVFVILTACGLTPSNPRHTSGQVATPTIQPACQPSQILTSNNGMPEIKGAMKSDGDVWALLFFDEARAEQNVKIVWRIRSTGTGKSFEIRAQHIDGTVISPIWGPEYHSSSNWERPGDEWGTGFNFPKPGCWTLTISSAATVGEIRIEVAAP